MPTGKIKVIARGQFGFIKQDTHGAPDVFTHVEDHERAGLPLPKVGNRYSFDIEESPKGLRATNLVALD
jgi:cold shock CspA family protein